MKAVIDTIRSQGMIPGIWFGFEITGKASVLFQKKETSKMLQEKDRQWLEALFTKFEHKMEKVAERSQDKIPAMAINGVHDNRASKERTWNVDDGIYWWTNGFWGGMLWMLYQATGKERYGEIARRSEEMLDACFEGFYGLHHDVGFMWIPTAVADYRLTGNADARRRGIHAANLLAGRFNPVGKFIRAWNDLADDTRGWAIIDCMLNINLLYWAYEETKDPRFKQIAMMHADTARDSFVRPDGSVKHIVEFDPETGELVRDYGGQGYGLGSSWTRGQTWGLYGFVLSYIHTGKQEYLDTAKQIAHYFIANIPEDGLIPVDFRQPAEPVWYDDTAAAVAACGLIEIAKAVPELEKEMYVKAALKLLKALDEKHSDWNEDTDCVLTHCSGSYHGEVHNHTLVYADCYYLEAILKLRGSEFLLW